MNLISSEFALFTLIVLLVYYLLPRRAQNIWLLLVSLGFAALFGVGIAAVLAGSILVNFFSARQIWRGESRKPAWFWIGLVANVAGLVFFRLAASNYLDRLVNAFSNAAFGRGLEIDIFLPIGFSFYTLQAISYLVDVYQKQIPACADMVDFGLYMAYFPKLLSGPIERARTFLPKLSQARRVDEMVLARAFTLILLGLVRKLIFTPVFSAAVPEGIFSSSGNLARVDLLFGLLMYAFWLYNDFAGYTSLVRGVSVLFGIELSQNFQQPYFARNFNEFWNRWHISLSHWLRDYIFFPLSRWLARRTSSQRHVLNIILPPMITMLVSGMWHNFGAYMLAWGGLHGIYQVSERIVLLWKPAPPPNQQPAWRQILSALLVFILTASAWTAFGSGSLTRTLAFWQAVIFSGVTAKLTLARLAVPLCGLTLGLVLDWIQYNAKDELVFLRWPRLAQAGALALVLFALGFAALWGNVSVTSFIYQGF